MDPGVPCYLSILRAIYSLLSLHSLRNAKENGYFLMARKDAITCNKKIDHNDSRSRHKIASTQFLVITRAQHFVKGVHLMSLGL